MSLRDYQQQCRMKVLCDWAHVDSTMAVLFTGAGKTHVFASLAGDWAAAGRGRVLIVAPQIDLVDQAAEKVQQVTGVRPAIEQGHRWANEAYWGRSDFVVASKQTLASDERYKRFEDIGLLVIDECDLAGTDLYRDIIRHFVDRGAKVLGVTASPKRDDNIAMGNFFDRCSYQYGIADGMPDGWLVPARVQCVQLESLDLSEVRTNNGEFNQGELQAVMETDRVIYEIAAMTAAESGLKKTVVFCGWVREARAVAELLVDRWGLNASWVCGDKNLCSDRIRMETLKSFTKDADGIQIVCNVGVLTRGWDFPGLEHIVMARPTMSRQLFTQIFGRGTRPLKGVVDFDGSTPELRRAAIASSAKPYFKFTDLRDNALEHKLISCVDVLGGSMSLPAQKRAKKRMQDGKTVDLLDALAEAARLQEQAEHAAERRKRARIEAKATYNRVEVDPFDETHVGKVFDPDKRTKKRGGPVMLWGKYKGTRIADLPTFYVEWAVVNMTFPGKSAWLGAALQKELEYRRRPSNEPPRSPHVPASSLDEVNRLFSEF